MKAIEISKDFILREQGHMIDRNQNEFQIGLSLEPKFGTELSAELRDKTAESTWYFRGKEFPEIWSELKQGSNVVVFAKLNELLNQHYELVNLKKDRDENPIKREVLHETVDGKTTTYYRDEDEKAFLDAVERTSMEPQVVQMANEYEEQVRNHLESTALNQIEVLLDHIKTAFDTSKAFKVIDI